MRKYNVKQVLQFSNEELAFALIPYVGRLVEAAKEGDAPDSGKDFSVLISAAGLRLAGGVGSTIAEIDANNS